MTRTTEGEKMTAHTPGEPCTTVVNCCQLHKAAPDMLAALDAIVVDANILAQDLDAGSEEYAWVIGFRDTARAALAKVAEAK